MHKRVLWGVTIPIILLLFLVSLTFLSAVTGCGGEGREGGNVLLRVTEGYGEKEIFSQEVYVDANRSVLDVLQEKLNVKLAYGNRFINEIEGTASGYTDAAGEGAEKMDWFFYANGVLSGIGAADYYPEDGDYIWWDFHSWDDGLFMPAVTGAFPATFVNGYNRKHPGVTIMHGEDGNESAMAMQDFLEGLGVDEVFSEPYDHGELTVRSRLTIVFAVLEDIRADGFWKDIQENRSRTGWLVDFSPEGIIPFNRYGEEKPSRNGNDIMQGAVLATGSGMGDNTPLWLFTAVDEESLLRLTKKIIAEPEKLSGSFAVAMKDDGIIYLP